MKLKYILANPEISTTTIKTIKVQIAESYGIIREDDEEEISIAKQKNLTAILLYAAIQTILATVNR